MYVRVLSFVCRSDVHTDHIQTVYREIVDRASELDGFLGSSLLMSGESCRGLALMYWRSREAAAAAGPKLVSLLGDRIHDVLAQPPDISGYDVVENDLEFPGSEA